MNSSSQNELVDNVDIPLSYSNRLLGQAEGVKTDFYTINFARWICSNLRVTSQGQRLYNKCLSDLPVFESADPSLQFGWGTRHLLRNLGVNLYEYEHFVLASALGELVAESDIARVFSTLADRLEDDDRPKPHLSSFRNFAHLTNGIMSTSEFAVVVDDRIQLNPYKLHSDRDHPDTVSVTQLAEILHLLSGFQDGSQHDVTIAGGSILGWLSAFADLCLGIDVVLLDKDGTQLHKSGHDNPARLKLKYVSPSTEELHQNSADIWLQEGVDPVKLNGLATPVLSGRISWQSLFSKTFGRAFRQLDQTHTKPFGNALGGLARVWEFFALAEGISPEIISNENRKDSGSWGAGLIKTWTNWFPELRHLQSRMEKALRLDHEGAGQFCKEAIERLEPGCGCFICSPTEGSDDAPTNLPKEGFCIPTLMETIIMLGLTLSRVTLTPSLYPSRAGLLEFYQCQLRRRLRVKKSHASGTERYMIIFGEDWNCSFPRRLANVATLFSGSRPEGNLPDNLVALNHEGICAYSQKLQRGDFLPARVDDFTVRVVSGSINWKQKTLRRVCLGPVRPPVAIDDGWETIKCEHLKDLLFVK